MLVTCVAYRRALVISVGMIIKQFRSHLFYYLNCCINHSATLLRTAPERHNELYFFNEIWATDKKGFFFFVGEKVSGGVNWIDAQKIIAFVPENLFRPTDWSAPGKVDWVPYYRQL